MADVNVHKTLKTILLDTALVNLPKSISPKMHPKDHISTPFVYLPKKKQNVTKKGLDINIISIFVTSNLQL